MQAMEPMMAKIKAKAFRWDASAETTQEDFKIMIK